MEIPADIYNSKTVILRIMPYINKKKLVQYAVKLVLINVGKNLSKFKQIEGMKNKNSSRSLIFVSNAISITSKSTVYMDGEIPYFICCGIVCKQF